MKIGIITRSDTLNKKARVFINETYIKKIIDYGHIPIFIYGRENLEEYATYCDALIIPGGYDIPSYHFQEEYDSSCTFYEDKTQDIRDFAILGAFVKKKKPILGICRGIQLLNVYFKGTLHQNINVEKHAMNHTHTITPTPQSFLDYCIPSTYICNSYHHQVIAKLGENLHVCATAEDGFIEAIAHDSLPIYGVQWHPELMKTDTVLPYFFTIVNQSLF